MEVLRHVSHEHPLIFNEERSHESEVYCSACGELMLGPRFSCMECGFHLGKNCAEAPDVMNHPFHRKHKLELKASSPYDEGSPLCGFCNNICWNFLYQCSCNLDLHVKCAFLSYKVLKNKFRELQHLVPIISSECHSRELEKAQCFACKKSLQDSVYVSPDYGYYLHKKCLELPLEINHTCHRHHSLFLQFNSDHLPCQICQETQHEGLVYCCSICEFVLHTGCVSPPPIIEDPSTHEHPFTRCLRNLPFNCDACGTLGNYVSYNCLTCSLMVHKKCITLPRFIKSIWHDHPISHHYFVVDNECTTHDCGFCHEGVNMDSGSYYCSKCKFIIHVNCALQDARWYYKLESKDIMLAIGAIDPSFFVMKVTKIGEEIINAEIKHFSHQHHLVQSDEVKDRRYCDGCSQLILTSFYGCLECGFFLHKYCAKLPKKKKVTSLYHQDPFSLIPHCIFTCALCRFMRSGFAYKCEVYICNDHICVRCAEIHLPFKIQGHKHPIYFHPQLDGLSCNACGGSTDGVSIYGCKTCSIAVHYQCILAPEIAWHKWDKHFLTLRYHEDNEYSEYHFCDICEGKRSPNTWFYHCAICDNWAHLHCVLGDYPFIKRGRTFRTNDHPHTLVSVQKAHHPKCCKCGEPCFDFALECLEEECKYISH